MGLRAGLDVMKKTRMETQLPCTSPYNLLAIQTQLSRIHSCSIHETELTRFIKLSTWHFIRILFEFLDQS